MKEVQNMGLDKVGAQYKISYDSSVVRSLNAKSII